MQKIGKLKVKTKDLIILFIKFLFSNQVQQAFKLLHTSIFKLNFKLSLKPNGFINVLFPIYLYHLQYASFIILDLAYTNKSLYTSQVQAYIRASPESN